MLVIEDNDQDFELMIAYLKDYFSGVDTLRVRDPNTLGKAMEQDWDVVLCDLNLPDFSWTEAMLIVRQYRPRLPFIIVSGSIEQQLALNLLRDGADDYLSKSDLKRLGWVVARLVVERETIRKNREASLNVMRKLDNAE